MGLIYKFEMVSHERHSTVCIYNTTNNPVIKLNYVTIRFYHYKIDNNAFIKAIQNNNNNHCLNLRMEELKHYHIPNHTSVVNNTGSKSNVHINSINYMNMLTFDNHEV